MTLKERLEVKELSIYECSKRSDIPYTTLSELVRNKTRFQKASVETAYRLSKVLDCSIEELYKESLDVRVDFELFKSNVRHQVKSFGDREFIVSIIKNDTIFELWQKAWYPEALYILAMVDYLCRVNSIPTIKSLDAYRDESLEELIYPADVYILDSLYPEKEIKKQALKEAIPEFLNYNIVECNIRDVC